MRRFLPLLPVVFLTWLSCSTPEEEVSFDPNLEVIFSTDTVTFDTLLSNARSSTRRLTVFNPNEASILFSEIRLGLQDSDYSVVINGKEQSEVFNEQLFGGDSMLILVETSIRPQNQNTPYLVKDSILFSWNGNTEHVKLVSWGQDASELRNQALCDVTWTNERPYLLKDTVLVQPNCTLTIEAGTTIFFDNDAALFIQGTMQALGDSAAHIVFRNNRFDGVFEQVPGQWNGIYFLEGSQNNMVRYAEIFNGQVGLRLGIPDDDEIPDVVVENTTIHTMSNAGILSFSSDLSATNVLVYNCGTYLAGHFIGGSYSYRHCTFSNEPRLFASQDPSVQFTDNLILDNGEVLAADLTLELVNTIVWGSSDEELIISNGADQNLTATLGFNIIRSNEEIPSNFTSQEPNFPGFTNPFLFDYTLDSLAFARDQGVDIGVPRDIVGAVRDSEPDIGAYERIDNQ